METDCIYRDKAKLAVIRALICGSPILKGIDTIPAADVRPVVRGKNIGEGHPADEFRCSNCGIILRDWDGIEIDEYGEKEIFEYTFNFCPNCGADTRESSDKDDCLNC